MKSYADHAVCPPANPQSIIRALPAIRCEVDTGSIVTQIGLTMKTASIRELRSHFPRLEALLFEGETIAITKRKRVVANLVPAGDSARPDFQARFGSAVPPGGRREDSLVTMLSEERGE